MLTHSEWIFSAPVARHDSSKGHELLNLKKSHREDHLVEREMGKQKNAH